MASRSKPKRPRSPKVTTEPRQIPVRIDPELRDRLKAAAADNGRTFTEEMRLALEAHLLIHYLHYSLDPAFREQFGSTAEAEDFEREARDHLQAIYLRAFSQFRSEHLAKLPIPGFQ